MLKGGALAIALLVGVCGCADSHKDSAGPQDAASVVDASAVEVPDAAVAQDSGAALQDRCETSFGEWEPCDAGVKYYVRATGVAADPHFCELGDVGYCDMDRTGFSTLSECAATCEAPAPDAADCTQAGTGMPACDASKAADSAELEMHTPYGSLHLTSAFLTRSTGFINDVAVELSAEPEQRFGVAPSVRFALWADVHATESLVGSHDTELTVTLCDRAFEVPARITVTVDEVVTQISERFEAHIESLAPDVELTGHVTFSHVCLFGVSD